VATQTVGQSVDPRLRISGAEPDFWPLLDRRPADFRQQVSRAGLLSLATHAVLFVLLHALPDPPPRKPLDLTVTAQQKRESVKLVAPRILEPTQPEPNRGKLSKEVDLASLLARKSPTPSPEQRTPPPARFPGLPAPSAPKPVEAPKLDAPPQIAQAAPGPLGGGTLPNAPAIRPAEPPPVQQPKLAFETPGSGGLAPVAGAPKIAPPKADLTEAVRSSVRPGAGGLTVGDITDLPSPGNPGLATPNQPGRMGSSLELLSDPAGVDFRPYLIQVLSAVKRNWLAVIPESARLGRRGRTTVQFIISKDGRVPKLVISSPSGAEALDRAAVAGVSASNPFPPLPANFTGEQIRLQLVFTYNMPR
jgi:TonB family protein